MQAEFSVQLGPHEPALEVPWGSFDPAPAESSAPSPRYFDLRAQPELLLNIPEAHHNLPLGEFLSALNSPASRWQTAKCDTWRSDEIAPDEQIFGAVCKYASYIDLFFADDSPRYSFERHQDFARSLCNLLGKAPEIAAAAEFVLRRCYFHTDNPIANASAASAANRGMDTAADIHIDDQVGNGHDDSRAGYCLTFYLSGFGDDDAEAHKRWAIGLKLVENAILQLVARSRV
jgi:hypothetical protein